MGKKSSRRRKPKSVATRERAAKSLPAAPWDHGTGTDAALAGTRVEPADFTDPETGERRNPNGVSRRRRLPAFEQLWRDGKLTDRQHDAAKKLLDRFEAMQKGPPAIKEIQVDVQPDFAGIEARRVDLVSRFHAVAKFVPSECGPIVDQVVFMGCAISQGLSKKNPGYETAMSNRRTKLSLALDAVADGLRL